ELLARWAVTGGPRPRRRSEAEDQRDPGGERHGGLQATLARAYAGRVGASFRIAGAASMVVLALAMAACDLVHTLGREAATSNSPAPPPDEPTDAGPTVCIGKTCAFGFGCHPTTGECAPLCAIDGSCAHGTYCDRGVCLYGEPC